jgi:hypothetical protein
MLHSRRPCMPIDHTAVNGVQVLVGDTCDARMHVLQFSAWPDYWHS